MGLEVDGADPEAFCFESFDEVAADEATGAVDEDAGHREKCPKMGLGSFGMAGGAEAGAGLAKTRVRRGKSAGTMGDRGC